MNRCFPLFGSRLDKARHDFKDVGVVVYTMILVAHYNIILVYLHNLNDTMHLYAQVDYKQKLRVST
jgi:hypothetical protein